MRHSPGIERSEVRALYAEKGFSGDLLDRIVAQITSDPEVWVAVMMSEEHHLAPVSLRRSLGSGAVVGLSSFIGSVIPLLPFAFLAIRPAVVGSAALAGAALFAIGALKARATVGSWLHEGLKLALIGLVTAALGWGVGALFRVPPG